MEREFVILPEFEKCWRQCVKTNLSENEKKEVKILIKTLENELKRK